MKRSKALRGRTWITRYVIESAVKLTFELKSEYKDSGREDSAVCWCLVSVRNFAEQVAGIGKRKRAEALVDCWMSDVGVSSRA